MSQSAPVPTVREALIAARERTRKLLKKEPTILECESSKTKSQSKPLVSEGLTLARAKSKLNKQIDPETRSGVLDSADLYYKDMRTHQVMSREEETKLAEEYTEVEIQQWIEIMSVEKTRYQILSKLRENFSFIREKPDRQRLINLLDAFVSEPYHEGLAREFFRQVRLLDTDRLWVKISIEILRKFDSIFLGEVCTRLDFLTLKAKECRNKFVNTNLRFVVLLAKRDNSQLRSDRIQNGNLGLIKAVERFDVSKGYRFGTYAQWWIRQSMGRKRDNDDTIRVPIHMHSAYRKMSRAISAYESQFGNDPTNLQLSGITKLSEEKIVEVKRAFSQGKTLISLDKTVGDGEASLIELLSDPHQPSSYQLVVDSIEKDELQSVIRSQLNGRELKVITLRFGFDGEKEHSLADIGVRFNLTRERIRQIEFKALEKIRQFLKSRQVDGGFNVAEGRFTNGLAGKADLKSRHENDE